MCNVEARPWKVFVDSASNAKGARVGIVIISLKRVKLEHPLMLGFRASNNKVEYEALLARLRATLSLEAADLEIYSNSQLVLGQFEGSFKAKDSQMIDYLKIVNQMMSKFQRVKIVQITRRQNKHADSSATLASSLANEIPQLIKVEVVQEPNINLKVEVLTVLSLEST